ncbi:MAG: leucyl/phenylalanyl-tRNA--protein transferase [Candidatus Liberibacter asiaticus]|nr:leucyl/phenylalanyl-tRNA--protein transferase [Candidatus Liberibacter asiaticus str. gxpsy]ALK06908.1 leucyl/phenylalanyl-tRNA--protein transferase [Candidatus Liberibacter asiaticus]BAP26028.1 leucyl/phenylalanyl-tRNA--protein transferase [Candidatus Liberibacter asiaticus str. Ishi-1]AWL13703.1 leucyl/phenylalanyl-tRNA--protein transferase [Candidatus Liberibacter asiaticus]KPG63485.1 leucyl/phenylalanyl-tRNA--protein transferase [Candidatus Liberibacter asiaticus]
MNIDPDSIIKAYSLGLFPMADSANSQDISWIKPLRRGIIPLETFHTPKRLKKYIRRELYDIRINTAFESVISACAQKTQKRPTTWINMTIQKAYIDLFYMGYAHTIEAWKKDVLVGGLYGVSLGAVFFGESMFSHMENASKICLTHLVKHLKKRQFLLLDIQFITNHLRQFGAIEITHVQYAKLLENALKHPEISFL